MPVTVASRYRTFAWAFLAYAIGVVLWGAFVRATGSGAGCGAHWPLCNGEVLPRTPTAETLVELTHRITSGFAWLLAAIGVVFARRAFPRGHAARRGAWATLFFMSTEGLVGAAIVLRELVAHDASYERGALMAIHLVNTFLLLGAMTFTAHAASGDPRSRTTRGSGVAWTFALAFASILAVGVSGAVTALGDTLFPVGSLDEALRQDLSPTAHLFVQLRVLHPVLGLASAAAVIVFAGWTFGTTTEPGVRNHAAVLVALLAAQVAIGFANVALLAPVWIQIVHLLVADLVWIALVLLGLRVRSMPSQASVDGHRLDVDAARAKLAP